ncbi:MAG: O-methyltransferase [Bacteroidales bacterium]|nr:O-methyltransferase [Bacteroidales bacterium]
MSDIPDDITRYAMEFTSPEDEVLYNLYRETNLTTVYPHMLSGHLQGRFLEMVSRMIRPLRILEIGTFTGYSAICMARGLEKNGLLHTIDINDELAGVAQKYFGLANLENRIVMHTGDACTVIPTLDENFDLVFIDGDKEQYVAYYQVLLPKVKKGGFILADNVLWGGKVLPGSVTSDKETKGIQEFNTFVKHDSRIEKMLLPFRDGIFILRKISD